MADGDPLYQINEQIRGVRFYNGTPLIGISSSLTIESNLSAIAGVIGEIQISQLSGDSSVSISSVGKVVSASASLQAESSISATSIEVLKFIAYLTGSAELSVSVEKTSKASSSLSSSVSLTSNPRRIIKSSSSQSSESSFLASSKKIIEAFSSLSSLLNINITSPLQINSTGEIEVSITSSLLLADVIRFTPNQRYPGSILASLLLDGQPLTAQGRIYDSSIQQVFIENKNWNNTKSRYYNRSDAGRESFKLSWEWLPDERQHTVDKRLARNYIKSKALDPDVHILTVISYGEDSEDVFVETQYNVFITNYSEELIRRDLTNGIYFWKCDLELEEV